MTDTTYRVDIVFYGHLVAVGDISRDAAADQLVEVSAYRISAREARQLIDTWQAYLTPTRPPVPPARSALLRRLFTRNHTARQGGTTA